MKWINAIPIIICLLFTGLGFASAKTDSKVITAEGISAGSSLQSRDEALNRALRRAVEQAVGTVIDTETMTKNFQLLDDKIYSDVKGYVKEYKIISDNKGEGNVYKIKVQAVVGISRLVKDIKALNIIKEHKGNPRIMVLIDESIDGIQQPSEIVQTEIENMFLGRGFPIVDKSQLQMVKERDVALYYNNPQRAAVLGRRFGAELVIVGQAVSNFLESSMPYGVAVFGYTSDITAKAIKADTASVIVSDSVTVTERGSGRMPTANKALKASGSKLAKKMIDDVTEKWRAEVFNTVNVQLVMSGLGIQDRDIIKKDIKAIRGVHGLYERSFSKGVLIMDINLDGAVWQGFESRLLKLPNIRFELVSKSENRIDLKKGSLFIADAPR